LFETYAGKFMTIAKRYMKEDMSAEDVLMEGFCKIYTNIKSFKGDGSFEGWMRRIIVNTAINKIRKDKREMLDYQEELTDKKGVEMMYVENMSANDMLAMIEKMPLGYRTVFNMYAIDGFTHKEIATELGIDEGTSRSQLSKARKFLQIRIKENESNIRI
jgi:RNA polymerase sigma-70 factor (ECF subfamily)